MKKKQAEKHEPLVLVKALTDVYTEDNIRMKQGSVFPMKQSALLKKYSADVKDEDGKVLHKKGAYMMETITDGEGKEQEVYKTSDSYEIVELDYDPVAAEKSKEAPKVHIVSKQAPADDVPNKGFEPQEFSKKEKSEEAVKANKKTKDDVI